MPTVTFQIKLSEEEARALKRRMGRRTVSAAVQRWIELGLSAQEGPEPLTPAQCRETFRGAGPAIKITSRMRTLGLTEDFFR